MLDFKKVIIEGPEGAGKSTLVNYIIENCGLTNIVHSNNLTKNDFEYHLGLLTSDNYAVYDRFNLGEIVYPTIFNEKPKMTLWPKEQEILEDILKQYIDLFPEKEEHDDE